MKEDYLWRVYAGQPLPRTFASKRTARRLMRRYARLGIQASLYTGTDDLPYRLIERRDAQGEPYRLADDPPEGEAG